LRLGASGFALSSASFLVVLFTASEEPFFVFRWSELVLVVGLGGGVLVLFVLWALACVREFRHSPRRSALGTVLVSACLLWTALNLFYLGESVYGYGQDMTDPRLRSVSSSVGLASDPPRDGAMGRE
jgi:hypothetical protein